MCEVKSTHLGGCNYPGSKSRACKDLKMANLFGVDLMFDEKGGVVKGCLERAPNAVPFIPS